MDNNTRPREMLYQKGDYSSFINSLKNSLCEKFTDISSKIKYDDPMVELIILMIMLIIGVIIIVSYLY